MAAPLYYVLAQCAGAIFGVVLAHAMFDQSLLQSSPKIRWGLGQWISETAATFGLLLTILGLLQRKAELIPQAVALYVVGAYWFTASTSFANPAVTLARCLSDTFAGIAPASVLPFKLAQGLGATLAVLVARILFAEKTSISSFSITLNVTRRTVHCGKASHPQKNWNYLM